jgi:uncharacterized protein
VRRNSLLPAGTHTVTVRTADGVDLAGVVVPPLGPPFGPPPSGRPVSFVVAHGFTNSVAAAPFRRLIGWLRPFGEVRALDFRGHGRSGGRSGMGGDPEMWDVDAAVAAARADGAEAVVTVEKGPRRPPPLAGSRRDPAPGPKHLRPTRPMQRVHWLLETTVGRRLGSRVVGLRLGRPWLTPPPSPLQVVSLIAPTPLLLVHGDRDEYFPLEHFRALAQAAGPSATAWVVPGFGHAESGATAPLVEQIGRWASATIAR